MFTLTIPECDDLDLDADLQEGRRPVEATLPCWLTEEEAQTLLLLCSISPATGGSLEERIFGKLGDLLRAYRK